MSLEISNHIIYQNLWAKIYSIGPHWNESLEGVSLLSLVKSKFYTFKSCLPFKRNASWKRLRNFLLVAWLIHLKFFLPPSVAFWTTNSKYRVVTGERVKIALVSSEQTWRPRRRECRDLFPRGILDRRLLARPSDLATRRWRKERGPSWTRCPTRPRPVSRLGLVNTRTHI